LLNPQIEFNHDWQNVSKLARLVKILARRADTKSTCLEKGKILNPAASQREVPNPFSLRSWCFVVASGTRIFPLAHPPCLAHDSLSADCAFRFCDALPPRVGGAVEVLLLRCAAHESTVCSQEVNSTLDPLQPQKTRKRSVRPAAPNFS
jgi:hypothetical protein